MYLFPLENATNHLGSIGKHRWLLQRIGGDGRIFRNFKKKFWKVRWDWDWISSLLLG